MKRRLRVLLVEDDPNDAEMVLRALRHSGYEPDWNRVQTEADFLASLTPDLEVILSDYAMPQFDGRQALALLCASGLDIPFITVSGTIGEDAAVESMVNGAVDYLLKDRLARLGQAVQRALDQCEMRKERRRTELALRESEERFRQVAENILEVFWVTDVSKNEIVYISPGYERIWKRNRADLMASPRAWLDAIHPDDVKRVLKAATTQQTAGTYDEEYRIVQPDGTTRWIHDRAFPVRDANGQVHRIVGTAQDITERKQADVRIAEQAALLDKAHDAIVVHDLNDRLMFWNRGAEQLYGWTAAETIGRLENDILFRDPNERQAAWNQVMERGEWSGELHHVTKAGENVIVQSSWSLVRDDKGKPKSVLSINTDITANKKLEAQFLRAQRLESIGTLAGGIAHDLNNVLTPIIMSIDLLKLRTSDPVSRNTLGIIASSAKRGAEMVGQVLAFARGVEGRRLPVHAGHLINELHRIIRETFPRNIQIRTQSEPNLWPLCGDSTQLHQVLLNLCINARDAMPVGGMLTLSAENMMLDSHYASMNAEASVGPHVIFTVEDNGSGMPQELIDKIFDPFFTTKEPGQGTGLGLTTCLAIAKSHRGFLRVMSESGAGTKFRLYLPAEAVSMAEPLTLVDEEVLMRGNDELILVVDDETSVREITRQTLESAGYRVATACNGVEAAAFYAQRQKEVALVLTDMMMPVMDGLTTIQVLTRINRQVRIIAASGITATGHAARAASAGVRHFLPKPYTAAHLLRVIHEHLHDAEDVVVEMKSCAAAA